MSIPPSREHAQPRVLANPFDIGLERAYELVGCLIEVAGRACGRVGGEKDPVKAGEGDRVAVWLETFRATIGMRRFFRPSAKSISFWQIGETAESGLSTKITASAPAMSCSIRVHHASPFSISSRSTRASIPRAFNASSRRLTKSMSVRE